MELLLVLTALLASLTGAMSGARAPETPQVELACAVGQAGQQAATMAARPATPPAASTRRSRLPLPRAFRLTGWFPPSERRLE